MNTPNPLIPQGALERNSKGKSTVRIAIFTIISIHAVFFTGLLMQGCRRDDGKPAALAAADTNSNQNTLPSLDPGYYPPAQEPSPAPPAATSNAAPQYVSEPTPSLPPAVSAESLVEGKPYTIASGDTLGRIAKANGTTIGAITKLNPSLAPNRLKPGQKIQLPTSSSAAPAPLGYAEPAKTATVAGSSGLHSVKAGENLTGIAKTHGTTVKAIRTANRLKSDRLSVGQKLKIPAPATSLASREVKNASAGSRLSASTTAQGTPLASTNMR